MTRIVRLSMVNWYLYSAQDVEMRGATAILGPNGVGKSSLLDAVQLVMTGNNRRYLKLNASSNVTSGAVKRNRDEAPRSVLGYCLGTVDGQRLRDSAITYVCLTFEDDSGQRLSAGISLTSRMGEQEEETTGSFIIPGADLTASDFLHEDMAGQRLPLTYDAFVNGMRSKGRPIEDYRSRSGSAFTKTLLSHLSAKRSVDVERFLRATRNGLQLKEIASANDFVRDFVLEADPLDIQSLRESVSRYRGFQDKISDLELQEKELREIAEQHHQLQNAAQRAASYDWMLARHRRDRSAARKSELRGIQQKLSEARTAQDQKAMALRSSYDEIQRSIIRAEEAQRHDDVGRAVAALQEEAAGQERVAASSRMAMDSLVSSAKSLSEAAASMRGRFPGLDLELLSSRGAKALKALDNVDDARRLDEVLADLLPLAQSALSLIEERRISVAGREHVLRAEMTDMQGRLRRMRDSGGAIGLTTARFLDMLSEMGVDGTPVCDTVEVADDTWRDIVESMLGSSREAVLVDEEHVSMALSMLRRNRKILAGCQVVTAVSDCPTAGDGSVASLVQTSDDRARRFIDARLGHISIADAIEMIESGHDAAMSDGTVTLHGAAQIVERVSVPMLGREARRLALVRLEEEIADRQSRADVHRTEMEKLAEAERELRQGAVMPTDETMANLQAGHRKAIAAMASLKERATILEAARPAEMTGILEKFETEQKRIAEDLAVTERELYETRLKLDRTITDIESADGGLTIAIADYERADEALLALTSEIDGIEAEYQALTERHGAEAFENAVLVLHRNASTQAARLSGSAPQMTRDFAWRHKIEGFDPTVDAKGQAAWVADQIDLVAGHGLRRYKEQADEARVTMEGALREHLLVKLYARITEARRQITELNRQLSVRRFHRQIYEVKVEIDGGYREIVEVARRVHEQTDDVADLFANPGTYGTDVARGVERVRAMIESDGDASLVGDYRNYLQFDLITRNDEGRIVSTHSSRASTGSGGERQVPFYIAVAAALASACYGTPVPGRRQTGLGLALFDEAFNALDDANISACLQFMSELGLQVIAAAPEGKRPQFMENVETVISIYRQGTHCEIDVEHTTESGRKEFREVNPVTAHLMASHP